MKQKLLFTLNLVLICAIGLGVSALWFTHRPSRPTITTETSLRSLKAANPANQNRLTSGNWDQLVTEVENLKIKVAEIDTLKNQFSELAGTVPKINTTWTDERGFILRMRIDHGSGFPSCDGIFLRQWKTAGKTGRMSRTLGSMSTSCYVNIDPEWKVVRVGNPCAVNPVVAEQDGLSVRLKYQKWTIDIKGKCSNLSEVTRKFNDWEYSILE